MTNEQRKKLAIELAEIDIDRALLRGTLKTKQRQERAEFDKVTRELKTAKKQEISKIARQGEATSTEA